MQASVGTPKTLSGTATSAWVRTFFTNLFGNSFAWEFTVTNDDAANDLLVSLDGGTTSVPIAHGGASRTFKGPAHQFAVKRAAGADAAYSVVASIA